MDVVAVERDNEIRLVEAKLYKDGRSQVMDEDSTWGGILYIQQPGDYQQIPRKSRNRFLLVVKEEDWANGEVLVGNDPEPAPAPESVASKEPDAPEADPEANVVELHPKPDLEAPAPTPQSQVQAFFEGVDALTREHLRKQGASFVLGLAILDADGKLTTASDGSFASTPVFMTLVKGLEVENAKLNLQLKDQLGG